MEGALVSLREYPKAKAVAEAQTDVDGKCELGPFQPRQYHLDCVSSDKLLSASQPVRLTAGEGASLYVVLQ
jgi:hypothetical protein